MKKRAYTCHPSITAEREPAGCMRPIGSDGLDLWRASYGDYHRTLSDYDQGYEGFYGVYYHNESMPKTCSRRWAEGYNSARSNRVKYTSGGVKHQMDLFDRGTITKAECLAKIQEHLALAATWPDMPGKIEIVLVRTDPNAERDHYEQVLKDMDRALQDKINQYGHEQEPIDKD